MSIGITGSPGTGKHTVAKEMASRMNLPIIDINVVGMEAGLVEESDGTGDVDTEILGEILAQKISANCIIVGHLAPYVLKKNQVERMIVLRRNPYDLIRVYRERNYPEAKIIENAGSEVLGIIAHDARDEFQEKTCQVDASNRTVQEVASAICGISKSGANDGVDWLGMVTRNDDLKKFFAD